MIIISPFAKKLLNGKENPKNYPYWNQLVYEIQKFEQVVQVGVTGERKLVDDFRKDLPISELKKLIAECKTWISCDSFFQHLAWSEGKPGIVLWSVSDPLIFGHPENTNLLKNRKYLEPNQFLWWEYVEHKDYKFIDPSEVLKYLK